MKGKEEIQTKDILSNSMINGHKSEVKMETNVWKNNINKKEQIKKNRMDAKKVMVRCRLRTRNKLST